MARLRFIVDTSVFARLPKQAVASAFLPLAGAVAVIAPVAFELGYSARNHDDYLALTSRLLAFTSIPVTDGDHQRALDVQAKLSLTGQHRSLSLVDALVAATAEARDLTVLHYDSDFERIAQLTGQRQQWIVARGTAD